MRSPACNAYQRFSKEHGHAIGGGNNWAQGNRRYLKRIRSAVKEINPNGIMTGENPCEIYNDLMDGYLLYVAHFPTSVPAFQAIYHDYVGTYGQFLSSPAVHPGAPRNVGDRSQTDRMPENRYDCSAER